MRLEQGSKPRLLSAFRTVAISATALWVVSVPVCIAEEGRASEATAPLVATQDRTSPDASPQAVQSTQTLVETAVTDDHLQESSDRRDGADIATQPASPALAVLDGPGPDLSAIVPTPDAAELLAATPDLPTISIPHIPVTGVTDAEVGQAIARILASTPPETLGAAERRRMEAVAQFYQARGKPAFTQDGAPTASALAIEARLARADYDGLDAKAYLVDRPSEADPVAAAHYELALARSIARYARDSMQGRVDPARISDLIDVDPHAIDHAAVLTTVANAADPAAALASFEPQHPGYQALKAELAVILDNGSRLAHDAVGSIVAPAIPEGPSIIPGAKDERVALLRQKLNVTANDVVDTYDPSLVSAVRAWQKANGIKPTGIVGPQTIAGLNGFSGLAPVGAKTAKADIIANMERWRWLPRPLGARHVMVNIPDYQLTIVQDDKVIHTTRVIVGKPDTQTPVFSNLMDHLVVNPYWNVPVSIITKEMAVKAAANGGGFLNRGNYEVFLGKTQVDPSSIDWRTVNPRALRIRQKPGDSNALGNIKFMFPNTHSVYIHDTSSRGLFANSERALSHGCVRVNDPFGFADVLLSQEGNLNGAVLKKMVGGEERYLKLKTKIPVHLAYFTTFVDANGQLRTVRDIYGHNAKVKAALDL